jgi:hypothetical protein
VTRDHVLSLFALLESAGIQPPYADEASTERAVRVWQLALHDLAAEQLEGAVAAHLRDPARCRWWPKPGELLQLVPRASPQTSEDGCFARHWPRLPGHLRVRLLDQAAAQIRESPACGRDEQARCPATCERCAEATLARADELARQELERGRSAA